VGVYIPDFVVGESIIVEIKSKPLLTKSDLQQFWYYLKNTDYKVGYLVNFGKPGKVELIRRVYDSARGI
jgi:GxxExxY protein